MDQFILSIDQVKNIFAKEFKLTVVKTEWLTPDVIRVLFTASKKIPYQPGQFLSLYVPEDLKEPKSHVRRAYSFAHAPEHSIKNGYELCMKYLKGGLGSEYIRSLRPGDQFKATAPYGDFVYRTPEEGRAVCFVVTSTGIGPIRSMLFSDEYRENLPLKTTLIAGFRTSPEILYPVDFDDLPAFDHKICLSQSPTKSAREFKGRVTDYLRTLPHDWLWHSTDFYLCGNNEMIAEVRQILMGGHGVKETAIFNEIFFAKRANSQAA